MNKCPSCRSANIVDFNWLPKPNSFLCLDCQYTWAGYAQSSMNHNAFAHNSSDILSSGDYTSRSKRTKRRTNKMNDFKLWMEEKLKLLNDWIDNISDTAYRANQDIRNEWHRKIQQRVFVESTLKYIEEFEKDENI